MAEVLHELTADPFATSKLGADAPATPGSHSSDQSWGVPPDETAGSEVALQPIWRELSTGRLRVVETFSTELRHYGVFLPSDATARGCRHGAADLERMLLGQRQKVLAYEADLCMSSLSMRLGDCLAAMGLSRRTKRVPLLLALLAQSSLDHSHLKTGRVSARAGYTVLSVARGDGMLSRVLSPGEAAVCRFAIDGHSHAAIARLRKVSPRTVANQLANAFRKLGVGCRFELICYVLAKGSESGAPLALATPFPSDRRRFR